MATVTMRSYAGETDLQAIIDLVNACEVVDRLGMTMSVSELRILLEAPSEDKTSNILLYEDADGKLIGFGQVLIAELGKEIDGHLRFWVHPNVRSGNLETQIIVWGEARMREVSQKHGIRIRLHSRVRDDQIDRAALLKIQGFTSDPHFLVMTRVLTEAIPKSHMPANFTLRQVKGEQDAEAWVELFNQSFINHWDRHEFTVESFKYRLTHPNYRSDLDLIAVATNGTFAAFCCCDINLQHNTRSKHNQGQISFLGTRPCFRKKGLGRAMLLAGMHRLKAAGVNAASLGVDAENLVARRLYESVGFYRVHTWISFVKNV